MIQRIVLLKLVDGMATDDGRHAVAEYSRAVLKSLPGVVSAAVAVAADPATAGAFDISLVLGFRELADLEPFRVNLDHRAYVDEYLRPQLAAIKAFNFEL